MPSPSQNITNVLNAYEDAARGRKPSTGPSETVSGGDFASLVKDAISEAKKIGERSEQLTIAGITDSADISQVITAVAEAEVAIQTVVSIRDKIIEAYKDIIRMPM